MVKRKFDKDQTKLGIKTLDWNIPENHISRFVVEFVEEVFPLLNIKEPQKKKGRDSLPLDSMLKLLIYAKIQHINRASIIADMARYHDIFRYVCEVYFKYLRILPTSLSIISSCVESILINS